MEKRYRGVKKWSSRYGLEIYNPNLKRQQWLGTFNTVEEGTHAYNKAEIAIGGKHTITNFFYTNSKPCSYLSKEVVLELCHLESRLQKNKNSKNKLGKHYTSDRFKEKIEESEELCLISDEFEQFVRNRSYRGVRQHSWGSYVA